MSLEHSSLTNRFLTRSRLLAEAMEPAQPLLSRHLYGASLTALEQSVCAWIAELTEAPLHIGCAWIQSADVAATLAAAEQRMADSDTELADLHQLRRQREEPGSFLCQLQRERDRDLTPALAEAPRAQAIDTGPDSAGDAAQLLRWIGAFEQQVELTRETAFEC